jgi:hypothetical protein
VAENRVTDSIGLEGDLEWIGIFEAYLRFDSSGLEGAGNEFTFRCIYLYDCAFLLYVARLIKKM